MCLQLEQWNDETIEKAAILLIQNQISKRKNKDNCFFQYYYKKRKINKQ